LNKNIQVVLAQKLAKRQEKNNLRKLSLNFAEIDFFSNDYLGLASNLELQKNISQEYNSLTVKNGATGSRLLSGNSEYVVNLERKLATVFKTEAALIFNTGFTANSSLISAVCQKGDTILYDELVHASLKEGMRLSFAKRFSFKHNDLEDLERKLTKAQGQVFILIESLYSMDGDLAPIAQLVVLAKKYAANIILDEAHSTGTYGTKGSGIACDLGLENDIFARVHTFGKAIGSQGACVLGSQILIDYLVNFALGFIYTTALPLHNLVSINCAFDYLDKNIILQEELQKNIDFFKNETNKTGIQTQSQTAIQSIRIQGNITCKAIAKQLISNNLDVRAILSPTVKEGKERLRICLHSFNKKNEIRKLVQIMSQAILR
jgi:8-amino-7-oxononanoate synthase